CSKRQERRLYQYEAHVPREIFPASRIVTIKKEICGIKQHSDETLHEYWRGSTSFVPHVHITRSGSNGHHTGRVQIKGRMQLKDSVQTGACTRAKVAINNQIQDTGCYHSNNSSSRKHHHQIAASNLEFQQTMSSSNLQFQ
ncbi:hypothetical protein CR513_07320, partial [Mucuna pruriens]